MPLCVICGKATGCNCKSGWRNIACCQEHYIEFINKYEGVSGRVSYKLRASDGRIVWDIRDYSVKNNDIELFTTLPNKSLSLFETEYLIILNDEKQYLLKSYEDDGQYIRIDSVDYERLLKLGAPVSIASNDIIATMSEDAESVFDVKKGQHSNSRRKKK